MGESSEICSFYKDTNILITGGTGFLGKILIEKLLRSTDVSTVYLLIRARGGMSAQQRFEELFKCEVFDRLKRECPKYEHRVKVIAGDCCLSGLGLCLMDRELLIREVNILFHVAATVKFDENLKRAFNVNVKGTRDMIQFAKEINNLKALVHVSTAYSNCYLQNIEEAFYPFPYQLEEFEMIIEKLTEKEVSMVTPRIVGQWPNTYTFTKALAENFIKNHGVELPIGIFRPSAVISTYREPVPGWTDRFNGPAGVAAAASSGVMRLLLGGKDTIADLIPVDSCVAALIAVGWDVAQKRKNIAEKQLPRLKPEEKIPIYNYVSSPENPIGWNEFTQYSMCYGRNYPVSNAQWAPMLFLIPNVFWYTFLKLFLHILPGLFIDSVVLICGKKPKMLRIYGKIHKLSATVSYFCLNTWTFSNLNTQKLWLKLNRKDRELFPMSMTTVHWLIFVRNYIRGVRAYLLKDPECTLAAARKRAFILEIINIIVILSLVYGFFSIFTIIISQVFHVIF